MASFFDLVAREAFRAFLQNYTDRNFFVAAELRMKPESKEYHRSKMLSEFVGADSAAIVDHGDEMAKASRLEGARKKINIIPIWDCIWFVRYNSKHSAKRLTKATPPM